jgi:hypothetical protein
MEIATFTRLVRTPTAELVEHLEDTPANKLALVEAVRLEFPPSAASGPLRGSARRTSTRRSVGGRTVARMAAARLAAA